MGQTTLYRDALGKGLECVLMQKRKTIAYAFRQLNEYGRNYLTHDLELAATMFALETWQHYEHGEKSTFKAKLLEM